MVSDSFSAAAASSSRVGFDEHADDLQPAPERRRDLDRGVRLAVALAAWPVVQPDRPGAEPRRLERVVEIGDAAELDPHRVKGTARLSQA